MTYIILTLYSLISFTIAEILTPVVNTWNALFVNMKKKPCFMSFVIIVRTLRIFVDDPCLILKFQNDICEGI